MVKKTTTKRARVSVDELKKFVTEFQKATSIEEVAATMAWSLGKVRTQATRLRKKGVPLKAFPRQSSIQAEDWESLKELCKTP